MHSEKLTHLISSVSASGIKSSIVQAWGERLSISYIRLHDLDQERRITSKAYLAGHQVTLAPIGSLGAYRQVLEGRISRSCSVADHCRAGNHGRILRVRVLHDLKSIHDEKKCEQKYHP
jgi:hypothetical protein